ncbi:MAG: hypothetical protein FWD80_04310, partial [Propionibacteriaceae bacterium]|nr:hypothetical protein [Propionibacteriaceae bacterium]
MFDMSVADQLVDAASMLTDPKLGLFTKLEVVLKVKQLMDAAEASVTVELAHDNDWDEDSEYDMEGLRPIRIGSDGTALVDETFPLEIAAAKGIGVVSATNQLRNIIDLEARHP